jgi:uncharacterized membrane protein YedE/YeeE
MIESTNFTPVLSAFGGVLIGLSAVALMLSLGKIAGISGIVRSALSRVDTDREWKIWFLVGMMVSAWLVFNFSPANFIPRMDFPLWKLIAGGLLVGFGTAMGSGCTSGHGVCGIARFSKRSIVATIVFMLFGVMTAVVVRHGFGV